MKTTLLAAALIFGIAPTVSAGAFGPIVHPQEPVVEAPSQDYSWNGFYAGGLVSFDGGDANIYRAFPVLFTPVELANPTNFGAFVGYNIQVNSLVFGGEIAYTMGNVELANNATLFFGDRLDLKARVGYSFGRAMVYGVAGYSFATFDFRGIEIDTEGMNFGAGIDFKINQNIFVGAEYLMRSLEEADSPTKLIGGNINSLSIRAGISF